MPTTRQAGYTLIELLIVIAIIGILVAVLIGNYSSALARGQRSAAQNHGRVVSLALSQWLSQNPLRTADTLNNTDCTRPTSFSGDAVQSTFKAGDLGWPAPLSPQVTCVVQAAAQQVEVATGAAGSTYVNGETP